MSDHADRVVEALRKHPGLLCEVRDLLNAPPPKEPPAGGFPPSPFPDISPEEWDRICDEQGMGKAICSSCGYRWCGSYSCL
jgi:hypothetical protein